jgi:hypothetical protein
LGLPVRTDRLFGLIAVHSPNPECGRAISAISERLSFVRAREQLLVDPRRAGEELARIEALRGEGDWPALRRDIAAYHRFRLKLAGDLIAALHVPPS